MPSNLLSVSQLTKQLSCSITFFPSHCVFQDLRTRKTIGGGREALNKGLYLFDTGSLSAAAAFVSEDSLSESVNNKERVRLWHTRLGHASLKCLKLLFPKKCFFSSDLDFQCETSCQFSKHCRTLFPLNNSSSPFSLIHSSVWGPAQVLSIFGFSYYISFIDDCTR